VAMKPPAPKDCKRLARHYGCDGVLVIAVDFQAEAMAGASWGADKTRCGFMAGVLDDMIDELNDREPQSLKQRTGG